MTVLVDTLRRRIDGGEAVLPLFGTDDSGTCHCSLGSDCRSPGKHPLVQRGAHDATLDMVQVEEWIRRWPQANFGARTDYVHRFDIDDSSIAEVFLGEKALALQCEMVRTPRPGAHLSVVPSVPVETRNLFLSDGRRLGEFRGLDSYVVIPPSRIGTKRYEAMSEPYVPALRLAEPLEWFRGVAKEFGLSLRETQPTPEYLRIGGIIHEGEGRHTALLSYAGRIWVDGLSPGAFLNCLRIVNEAQCRPPLPERELEGIATYFIEGRPQGRLQILSAGTRDRVLAERIESPPVFRSARQLASMVSPEVAWIARPWLVRGGLTELDGKAKSSGKTTWITHMIRAILDGRDFMGQPTVKSKVVFLSEQGDQSLRETLRRADLLDRDDLFILSWRDVAGMEWPAIVQMAVAKCMEVGALVLVVDTLPQFAGLEGESENSTGEALAAMRPLQLASMEHDLALLASRHERKSGGPVGEAGRGSSAFTATADIVLSLRRPEGNAARNIRMLHGIGRFDETPDITAIALEADGYRLLGDQESLGTARACQAVRDVLPGDVSRALTVSELEAKAGLGRTMVQDALNALMADGEIQRHGGGKKGDPYRFARA